MKRLLFATLSILLLSSALPYQPPPKYTRARPREAMSIYELSELVTGAPHEIVEGLAFAESSKGRNLNHPDPHDVGVFGLHETYHDERAARWGEYHADNATESAIIAGRIIMHNYRILGDMDLAIAAYKQGVEGVRRNGPERWYIERVKNGHS